MSYIITLVLILLSALFSGLTLGLMGLDTHVLKRKMNLGNKQAAKIYPIRKKGNLLLTTLLLGNVAVNAILAIFLGSIASGFIAGLVSTALIFVFGEIIPQAVISRHALAFGAKTAWIVRAMIILLFPITFPIAWILDRLLGDEMATVYSRGELISVIQEHEKSTHSDIDQDEGRVLRGALTFSDKTVSDVMTPETVMATIRVNQKLNQTTLRRLRRDGHSRFPVFDEKKEKIIGTLYMKKIAGKDVSDKTVKNVYNKTVHFVDVNSNLDDVLNAFLKTRHHLFIATDEFGGIAGLITVEDILEEIVGSEIMDEFDRYPDMRKVARKKAPANTTA